MADKFSKNILIAILIVTIVIDIMGLGLVFPIMPSLFFDSNAVTFGEVGGNFQNWYYSIALASWPLGLVLGGPILGELSDKYGRKIVLLSAVFCTSLSYMLSAYAIYSGDYLLFIASRFISGLAGGAFEIAQAAVIDISSEEEKSKNLGFITMAASLGFIIGPITTSFAASMSISHTLPFFVAAIISLVNMLFIFIVMKKDLPKHPGLVLTIGTVYKTISFLLSDKRIRLVGVAYLLMQAAWGFYGQGIALFLNEVYSYNTSMTGLFYAATGLAVAICSLFFQPYIFKKITPTKAFIIFAVICSIGLISTAIFANIGIQWLIGVVGSASQLICYTALLTIISSSVTDQEQGKAMGAAGAGFGMAWFLNDIMMGHLVSKSIYAPLPFGGVMFIASIFMLLFALRKRNKSS
ncbi:MFS transporter [Pseudofrancisella aestuarii]|uniref:MFS transporter n=1 Tax=Pseudofrancisella aestuarii TaxID=2670347 RepID=A0ABV9TA23_9GAMM|nr:MFS transporter [Pseudofrancisella aestuarii]